MDFTASFFGRKPHIGLIVSAETFRAPVTFFLRRSPSAFATSGFSPDLPRDRGPARMGGHKPAIAKNHGAP